MLEAWFRLEIISEVCMEFQSKPVENLLKTRILTRCSADTSPTKMTGTGDRSRLAREHVMLGPAIGGATNLVTDTKLDQDSTKSVFAKSTSALIL
jgi:hypothetical protein